jgi:hypothetical protein
MWQGEGVEGREEGRKGKKEREEGMRASIPV